MSFCFRCYWGPFLLRLLFLAFHTEASFCLLLYMHTLAVCFWKLFACLFLRQSLVYLRMTSKFLSSKGWPWISDPLTPFPDDAITGVCHYTWFVLSVILRASCMLSKNYIDLTTPLSHLFHIGTQVIFRTGPHLDHTTYVLIFLNYLWKLFSKIVTW